jgi:hypothetical protein
VLRKIWHAALAHPADAVSVALLIAIAATSVLDLFGAISVSGDFLSRSAIAIGSLLALQYIVSQRERRSAASVLNDLNERVEGLIASREERAAVLEIESPLIRDKLEDLQDGSPFWYFRGGSGRWQRSSVLPALAKNRASSTEYLMQIVDPTDEALCARYAEYRSKQRSVEVSRANEGRPEVVRDDLLACIYAAGWYGARSRVGARVFLNRLYSPVRIDIAAEGLMLTVADRKASGVFAPNGSWYYKSIVDEMREALAELPEIILPSGGEDLYPSDWTAVGEEHVKAVFNLAVLRRGGFDGPFNPGRWAPIDYAQLAKLAFHGRREE